jgi:hypothetical protein
MSEPVLPNFFIVGPGKAGTTSLHHYLAQHPQIYMSPVKEPCYFADEIFLENLTDSHRRHIRRMSQEVRRNAHDRYPGRSEAWLIKNWDDYVRLFEDVRCEVAIGESSVAYLWSETAARNIASKAPEAKIVMILRDPADRAFSQYLHQLSMGFARSTFRKHLERCLRNTDRKISAYYPFLEVGLYTQQVMRYLERFPSANIRIYWYEEAWKDPRLFLRDMFQFLGVDPEFCPDLSSKKLERRAPRFASVNYALKQVDVLMKIRDWMAPEFQSRARALMFRSGDRLKMSPDDRRFLTDYYREDVTKLASLLGRDLSAWLL